MRLKINNGQEVLIPGVSGSAVFVDSPRKASVVFNSNQRQSEFKEGHTFPINGKTWKVSTVESGKNSTLIAGLEPVEGN